MVPLMGIACDDQVLTMSSLGLDQSFHILLCTSEVEFLATCSAISSPKELGELAELGVLFLLFEMGLELSSDRLRALRIYAFGLGTVQVLATTAVFVAFAIPFGSSVGTWLLQNLAFADAQIAAITSWDEALVIAVALSLSSSAFVLQLLGDRGQLASRSGSATLGILLFQVWLLHVLHEGTIINL